MLPRSVITFFCDDIREEKSGMDTLIGIHPDNVIVPSIPFAFSKIAIYTRINVDVEDSLGDISVIISTPNNDDIVLSTLDKKMIKKSQKDSKKQSSPMVALINKAISTPFHVSAPGQVKLIVIIEGQEYVGGVMNFKQTPAKSGSPTA